jgi:dipeptidyl aminopeptidase/acylaminoacyl peptidase
MTTGASVRDTPLYREVVDFFTALYAPGTDHLVDASDLSVTPDGNRASFTGTIYTSLEQPAVARIVTVDLDSGELRWPAAAGTSSRLPRWSPDGETLAYLSDARVAGDFQISLARRDEASREAPIIDGNIESLQWSPDGTMLLIGVAGRGADLAGFQGGGRTQRPTGELPHWMPTVDSGDAEYLWRHAWMLEVATGRLARIGPLRLNVWECCWLGATRIAAVVSDSHSEGSWYTARLVAMDLVHDTLEVFHETTDQLGVPRASESGQQIALIEAFCSDRQIVAGELVLFDLSTNITRRIDTFGVDVTDMSWGSHGSLTYAGLRGLATVVGVVDTGSGTACEWWADHRHTCGGWYPNLMALPQGGALVVGESFGIPPEIAHVDATGYRVIRSLGTEQACASFASNAVVDTCEWRGRDGLELQGLLIRPSGVGPWPVVTDIHGGPVGLSRNRWCARLRGAKILADHGVASFYPNPRGSSGRGRAFAHRVKGDMGGEDAHDCLRGIESLVDRGIADTSRLGVTGISYGGFMSAWLVTQCQRFAAAVPISGISDWYSYHRTTQIPFFSTSFLDGNSSSPEGQFFSRSPAMFASQVITPVLQLTGALDQNTPPTQALEFHRSLLEAGSKSVLVTYPCAGHGIRALPEVLDAITRYVDWFLIHFSARQVRP